MREQDLRGDVGRGVVRDPRLARRGGARSAAGSARRRGCGRGRGARRPSELDEPACPRRRRPRSRRGARAARRRRGRARRARAARSGAKPSTGRRSATQRRERRLARPSVAPSAPVNVTRPGQRLGADVAAVLGRPALEPGGEPLRRHLERVRLTLPSSARSARELLAQLEHVALERLDALVAQLGHLALELLDALVAARRRRDDRGGAPARRRRRRVVVVEVLGEAVAEALLLLARAARELGDEARGRSAA